MDHPTIDVPVQEAFYLALRALNESMYILSESDLLYHTTNIDGFTRRGEFHFYWQEPEDKEPYTEPHVIFRVRSVKTYASFDQLLIDEELSSTSWRRDALTASVVSYYEQCNPGSQTMYAIDIERGPHRSFSAWNND